LVRSNLEAAQIDKLKIKQELTKERQECETIRGSFTLTTKASRLSSLKEDLKFDRDNPYDGPYPFEDDQQYTFKKYTISPARNQCGFFACQGSYDRGRPGLYRKIRAYKEWLYYEKMQTIRAEDVTSERVSRGFNLLPEGSFGKKINSLYSPGYIRRPSAYDKEAVKKWAQEKIKKFEEAMENIIDADEDALKQLDLKDRTQQEAFKGKWRTLQAWWQQAKRNWHENWKGIMRMDPNGVPPDEVEKMAEEWNKIFEATFLEGDIAVFLAKQSIRQECQNEILGYKEEDVSDSSKMFSGSSLAADLDFFNMVTLSASSKDRNILGIEQITAKNPRARWVFSSGEGGHFNRFVLADDSWDSLVNYIKSRAHEEALSRKAYH